MTVKTNAEVQELFDTAISLIPVAGSFSEPVVETEVSMLRNMLVLYKAYTASGNNIPALAGVGLEGAMSVASSLVEEGFDSRKRYINFRNLYKGFTG